MILCKLNIKNYKSIVDSGDVRIERLQAFVGENNAGKSNILRATECLLASGIGSVDVDDFYSQEAPIIITAHFKGLTEYERARFRPYLLGDTLIIEKHIELKPEARSERIRPVAEYHGYVSKPKDWWLSTDGVFEHEDTTRPNWKAIAEDKGILDRVAEEDGRVTKTSYETGLKKMLVEDDTIEYEEPTLGQTQALGLQQVLVNLLPSFHMLPAISDYSNEIDKRASSTGFRRLMSELSDRIIKNDPKYAAVEGSIKSLKHLLNSPTEGETREPGEERLEILSDVESKLNEVISKLMPSVIGVRIKVAIDDVKDVFARGVSIDINDGIFTDVQSKGHGLQRCVIFGLLQALILHQRGKLIETIPGEDAANSERTNIILVIEEPELYIHPQMQRLIYTVLKSFSTTDQVIYSTHSPAFVDMSAYESVAIIRKESVAIGTKACQCDEGVFDSEDEKKAFQFINSFNTDKNRMFFADKVILVEGQEDEIALLATGRDEGLFLEFPEEIGYTVIPSDNKDGIKKCMKLLNAFGIKYTVLHELDGNPLSAENTELKALLQGNKCVELPDNLENELNHTGHFRNVYDTKRHCENPRRIPTDFRQKVNMIFTG